MCYVCQKAGLLEEQRALPSGRSLFVALVAVFVTSTSTRYCLLLILCVFIFIFGLCFEKACPDLHELHEVAILVTLDCCSFEGVET